MFVYLLGEYYKAYFNEMLFFTIESLEIYDRFTFNIIRINYHLNPNHLSNSVLY